MHKAYLAATVAHVWLLAGVNAGVDGERGALDELFTTARPFAAVRAHAGVNAFCNCRVSNSAKTGADTQVRTGRRHYHDGPGRCGGQSPWNRSGSGRPLEVRAASAGDPSD